MSFRKQLHLHRVKKQAETWGLVAAFAQLLSEKVKKEHPQTTVTTPKDNVSGEKTTDLSEKSDVGKGTE